MYGIILAFHMIVCLLLIIAVLLQSGKSADLAGAFGGMGSQSTFGPRGAATLLSKLTTTLAILFMVTSLSLWITASNRSSVDTVVKDIEPPQQTETTQPPATKDVDPKATEAETETATTEKTNTTDETKKEDNQEKKETQ